MFFLNNEVIKNSVTPLVAFLGLSLEKRLIGLATK